MKFFLIANMIPFLMLLMVLAIGKYNKASIFADDFTKGITIWMAIPGFGMFMNVLWSMWSMTAPHRYGLLTLIPTCIFSIIYITKYIRLITIENNSMCNLRHENIKFRTIVDNYLESNSLSDIYNVRKIKNKDTIRVLLGTQCKKSLRSEMFTKHKSELKTILESEFNKYKIEII